jgi:hypothetical protein
MTDDDKALVERLRAGDLCDVELAPVVADRIEALSAENERTGQSILMWLGAYRDQLSDEAITNLQSIARVALGEQQ